MKASQALDTGSIPVTRSIFDGVLLLLGFGLLLCGCAVTHRDVSGVALPADSKTAWVWPVDGDISLEFGSLDRGVASKGILIRPVAMPRQIRASAAGRIGWLDRSDGPYGQSLVLIHGEGLVSVYAGASALCVRAGQRVERGETIALLERFAERYKGLYFEMRESSKPVDPVKYIGIRKPKV